MQFAMVEVAKGIIEPLVLTGSRGDRLTGRHLTGDIVSFPVASVVHAGLTGDEPPVVYQFCPTWIAAAMRAAGVQRLRTAVAANPEGDEEDDGPKLIDPGQVKYQSGEMIVTADSRRTRRKEGELFRSLSKKTGGMWSGYEVGHEFGYIHTGDKRDCLKIPTCLKPDFIQTHSFPDGTLTRILGRVLRLHRDMQHNFITPFFSLRCDGGRIL